MDVLWEIGYFDKCRFGSDRAHDFLREPLTECFVLPKSLLHVLSDVLLGDQVGALESLILEIFTIE
jgi:hypothetical protein